MWIRRRLWWALNMRMDEMEQQIIDIMQEVRESKTVQDGLRAQNRKLREALDSAMAKSAGYEQKLQEAKDFLDQMDKEGEEALLEGTEFEPSGN